MQVGTAQQLSGEKHIFCGMNLQLYLTNSLQVMSQKVCHLTCEQICLCVVKFAEDLNDNVYFSYRNRVRLSPLVMHSRSLMIVVQGPVKAHPLFIHSSPLVL
jgi:hypothetical protein